MALTNLKLREKLRTQSVRDPLTGLFNRRYMEETLERELRRAERKAVPVGIIMLDLDHFKTFNDSFGHLGGDALLRSVGEFVQARFRREDVVCRYGGDEFAIILPETSLEATGQRAEQLREEIKTLQVQYRGKPLSGITLSAGLAAFPEHGTALDNLMQSADTALYRAKIEGRDRVVTAHSPE
jgi:diguanylate cyclase (GGDEF)-like protein